MERLYPDDVLRCACGKSLGTLQTTQDWKFCPFCGEQIRLNIASMDVVIGTVEDGF